MIENVYFLIILSVFIQEKSLLLREARMNAVWSVKRYSAVRQISPKHSSICTVFDRWNVLIYM